MWAYTANITTAYNLYKRAFIVIDVAMVEQHRKGVALLGPLFVYSNALILGQTKTGGSLTPC